MSFFKFYLLWFISFIAGILLIEFFALEPRKNILLAFLILWMLLFFAKAIHSVTKNFLVLSDSFLVSIKNFSFKRFFSSSLVIVPFVLIFVVAPIVLVNYIGGWVFLVIPL